MNKLKRLLRITLCGVGFHYWKPIEGSQFYYTGKYKCKNCGRREIFPNQ